MLGGEGGRVRSGASLWASEETSAGNQAAPVMSMAMYMEAREKMKWKKL